MRAGIVEFEDRGTAFRKEAVMLNYIVSGVLALAATGVGTILVLRWRFIARLRRLEERLARAPGLLLARDDLPAEVIALAERQGARPGSLAPAVELTQTGVMWPSPEAKEMGFSAHQTIAASEPGFVWRANFGPAGLVAVADYFVDGKGGLEARIAGAFPVATLTGSEEIAKGELMRYLAELPWHPDAMLCNRALEWQVLDPGTIKVATGEGKARAGVTFFINTHGFVSAIEASDRPQLVDGKFVERPWRGRFWDYRQAGGRITPAQAEIAWVIDGKEFVYWKGTVASWRTAPVPRG
jgi:hypothetical protein